MSLFDVLLLCIFGIASHLLVGMGKIDRLSTSKQFYRPRGATNMIVCLSFYALSTDLLCLYPPSPCNHREIEDRIGDWSDKVCAKLDEALAYFHLKNKKGQQIALSKAAEHSHVPYPHLLLWYIK